MIAKLFLTIVGLMYLGLALWCTADPNTTSQKVGFELEKGSGQSEFVTVYGGLEFGIALILMMPLLVSDSTRFALLSCLLIHASLVLFRTISYFSFTDIGSFTHRLAAGEWIIFLASLAIWFWDKKPDVN